MPDSALPTNLRNESRVFCGSLTAVFGGKELAERTDVLSPLN